MSGQDQPPVTQLLHDWQQGDESALAKIAGLVDAELRRLAASYMNREREEHTLQPTALVNEAYLRLMAQREGVDWQGRSHFVAIAAKHMRQILVDHARRHIANKRGAGVTLVPIDSANAGVDARPVDLLALDEALNRLAQADARKARVMELKYFGGLEMNEIAGLLNVSVKTIEKDAHIAKAWLRATLTTGPAAAQT